MSYQEEYSEIYLILLHKKRSLEIFNPPIVRLLMNHFNQKKKKEINK